jgi:hypothetical protein
MSLAEELAAIRAALTLNIMAREALEADVAALKGTLHKPEMPCLWSADEDGCWLSDCGQLFTFDGGGDPLDHGFIFCPYCGTHVGVVPFLKGRHDQP